ncbi:hypothetical protein CANCADRAFT_55493 [Tortispora caseinolytica NRRL Y-17796]|uniref:Pre-mRNA-splicing factor ISY1 n=1 Tax=Tortispora caseinolytica NRRL Y-17796 TaxID=767744 RepID=A0A1E4TJ20_9ASCO|nr:hypothetical protein CANCADRAFT_55493 [Tortispora caseinolytica NRRL Y-17796]
MASRKESAILRQFEKPQVREKKTQSKRRPKVTQSVETVSECLKWRNEVVREISKNLTIINDSTVSISLIRDLNDTINKLMNEKYAWEARILELGGPNYIVSKDKRGYKYYGRAKELPDVQEMLQSQTDSNETIEDMKPAEIHLSADYYGYVDETDLVEYEAAESQRWKDRLVQSTDPAWTPLPTQIRIPDQSEIEASIVQLRKQALREQYLK